VRAIVVLGVLAVVVLVVGALVVIVDGRDDVDRPIETSVAAIVDVPPRWYRKAVRVTGVAAAVDGPRFVMRGGGSSIIVQPEPDSVDGDIRRGERVTVTGTIRRIDRLQAADLSRLLATGGHPELAAAPTKLGDVFVAADDVDA
jgi:hypothetical protein